MTEVPIPASPSRRLTPFSLLLLIIIIAAPLLRYTPLSGSVFALVWVAAAQVLAPGYLLARLLIGSEHPISQFAAALLCGIAMTVIFGAGARLIGLPVSAYLIIYTAGACLALLLSYRLSVGARHASPLREYQTLLFKRGVAQDSAADSGTRTVLAKRQFFALYLLLAACCLIVFTVATIRSQFRFRGYADQTEFIAIADWLANEPDDPFVYSRRLGVFLDGTHDVRYQTDGWTYTHAAWAWGSGVPAAELIWYGLTPLFAWSIPLAYFALGYAGSRRVSAGVFSAAGVTLVGLLTLDALVYNPTNLAFGQFALFQLNTARTFSLALMLPLATFAALEYLHRPGWRGLALVALAGLALALLHPMQVAIFQLTVGAAAGLWWLMPPRRNLKWAFALLAVLLLLLTVPLMQRAGVDRLVAAEGSAQQFETDGLAQNATQWGLLPIIIPVLGETYVANPQSVFYHPLVLAGAGIGLLALLFIRRRGEINLLALYLFAATLAALLVLFTPGIAALVGQFVVPRYLARFVFALPVGVAVGAALAAFWEVGARHASPLQRALFSFSWTAGIILLLAPITLMPASARDQIYASDQMQRTRDIQPFDAALLDALREVLPSDQRSSILAPIGVDSLIIESLPNTLITGGRIQLNTRTYLPTQRFFDPRVPWLDETDIAFLVEYGVTHVIVEADDTRLPQLLIDTSRFDLLATAAGFYVFGVTDNLQASDFDALFAEMNALYTDAQSPRWENGEFHLARAGDPQRWADMREAWDALPAEDAAARYGMAFAALLAGDDDAAVSTLQTLRADYPQLSLLREAAAHLLRENSEGQAGAAVLTSGLSAEAESVRILAARALLTEPFMYLLDAAAVDGILAVIDAAPVTWAQLATYEQDQAVRERAALLMTKGERYYPVVSRWLSEIADVHQSAQDLVWRAQIALAAGDVDGALNILRPATDQDWVRAKAYLHPDRWALNTPAALLALDEERWGYFVALLQNEKDPFGLVTSVELRDDQTTIHVNGAISNVTGDSYPIQSALIRVSSADASSEYARAEVEAVMLNWTLSVEPMPGAIPALRLSFPPQALAISSLPPLTPVRVTFELRHSETVIYKTHITDLMLNRPDAAVPPADATPANLSFGDSITLESYTAAVEDDTLRVGLYWRAFSQPTEEYQVFVHVVNEAGEIVRQRDIAPLDGRYPTRQWLTLTLIEDVHTLSLADLPAGTYRVRIGLYALPDAVPLPVLPADDPRVENNTVYIYAFER